MSAVGSRRGFLRSAGRAAAALPACRLLAGAAAHAAGAEQPLRFIGLYVPHGVSEPLFARRPGETETSYSLTFDGSVLAPFDDPATFGKSWKDRVTIVEGIDLAASLEKGVHGHMGATGILTGSGIVGDNPLNESLDQFLAVTRGLGASTPFSSVVLSVGDIRTRPGNVISYARGGVPLPKIHDPAAVYKMLFASLALAGDPAGMAALERARLGDRSVLDYLKKDIARLGTRLGASERLKLDQHLASLRELEKRLAALPDAAPTAACRAPAAPNPAEFPKLGLYDGGEAYLDRITDLQMDLLAQAMACDLTRFATLFVGMTESVHQKVAHQYDGPKGPSKPGAPDTWAALGKQNLYYFGKCARLMKRLDDMGILDSTLIYMTSDFGDPAAHRLRNLPTVLAGGARGRIKLGRRIVLGSDCPPEKYDCSPPRLTSNNKILVAIAQAFGVPVDSFGTADDPAITAGALSALQ